MALSYNLGYQESISVHPTRRQNFAGKGYSIFPNIWEWVICSKHDYGGVKVVLRFWVRVERMLNRFALMLVESGNKVEIKSESYIKREMNSESYRMISDGKWKWFKKGFENEAYCKVVAVPARTQRIPLPGRNCGWENYSNRICLPILIHGFYNYTSFSA